MKLKPKFDREFNEFVFQTGIDRLCRDTEFMIGRNPGWYWRTCWGILTPLIMVFILLYTLISYKPLTYKGQYYPSAAYGKHFEKNGTISFNSSNPIFKKNVFSHIFYFVIKISSYFVFVFVCSCWLDNNHFWINSIAAMGILCCDKAER